ncbi:MAG: hypothetical protein PHC88_09955 [Terrimicrobiaceae bacterium]|nr:hypothetical protein [Terrimicrobiaceae bacterium]
MDEAVFRSRWVGEQMDIQQTAVAPLEPSIMPSEESPFLPTLEEINRSLGAGLRVGPLEIRPSVEVGWEYSTGNNNNGNTGSANNSAFLAPSIALIYEREIGPWSVSAKYGGGYVYYVNPDYTAAGVGDQRNPFQQTGSLQIGVQGSRYQLNASVSAFYGTGFDAEAGQNNNQLGLNAAVSGSYQVSEWITTGGSVDTSQNFISSSQNVQNSRLSAFGANGYVNYAWTGKTSFQVDFGAGQDGQTIGSGSDQARRYAQVLGSVIYRPTEKLNISAGIGARYVDATNSDSAQQTGLLPAYSVRINYTPTEKISATLSSGLQGTDVRPSVRLDLTWQPREKTGLSLGIYQEQSFSTIETSQVRVARGIVASLTQRFFRNVDLSLSAGYERWYYVNGSGNDNTNTDQNVSQDSPYVSCLMNWQIQEWIAFRALFWAGTGEQNNSSSPSVRASVGLNFTF